jgi:UDP-N-acetylglucosamine 2-epimerase (non-hydrolysing)
MKEKLVTVFGTRPEIIRLSALIPKLDEQFDHKIINTYQNHMTNLNDLFLDELKIRKPDYNLDIRHENYGVEISDIIQQVWDILNDVKPSKLLVLGDTYSCLSVMPASNLGIKIYHMEAGMRSGDWRIPEEKNRKIVDNLSTINMAYTENSRRNLLREGMNPLKTFVTGNPIIEVLEKYRSEIAKSQIIDKLDLDPKGYYLTTIHRAENVTDEKALKDIVKALEILNLQMENQNAMVVFTHPRFLESMEKFNIQIDPSIRLRRNIGFFDFVKLQMDAKCVLTDSGTVPEECAYMKTPCVTVRSSTERPELVDLGTNIIAGTNCIDIVSAVEQATKNTPDWDWEKSLGDGRTSEKVLRILKGVL